MSCVRVTLALIIIAFAAAPAPGQEPDSAPPPPARRPSKVAAILGAELSLIEGRGDFRTGSSVAAGYGLRGGVGLGKGIVDLAAAYRSIMRDSRSYGDTSVNNMMRTLAVEARLIAPFRLVRPYVGGSLGVAYFGTETSVHQCCDDDFESYDEFEGVDLMRFAPLASSRFGLVVDVPGAWNRSLISIDVGVENHHGGKAAYQIDGRGAVFTSRTNYRLYSLGIAMRTGR